MADARTECWVLLFLVLPQIGLYGIVAAAVAAQNARGKFALASAAPAIENLGLIATLVFVSVVVRPRHVTTCRTATSSASASAPRWPSRCTPRCSASARRAAGCRCGRRSSGTTRRSARSSGASIPAAGTASLDASWLFIIIVAAGTVPGGVVAIQIGINFYYMPVALSAKAAGTVLLPRLSREALHNKLVEFRETYDLGISWSWFVAVPASLTLLVSSQARSRSRSRSARCAGTTASRCSSAAIAGLGLALMFATMYEFAKQTCYARHDVSAPLVGCAAMVALLLVGVADRGRRRSTARTCSSASVCS